MGCKSSHVAVAPLPQPNKFKSSPRRSSTPRSSSKSFQQFRSQSMGPPSLNELELAGSQKKITARRHSSNIVIPLSIDIPRRSVLTKPAPGVKTQERDFQEGNFSKPVLGSPRMLRDSEQLGFEAEVEEAGPPLRHTCSSDSLLDPAMIRRYTVASAIRSLERQEEEEDCARVIPMKRCSVPVILSPLPSSSETPSLLTVSKSDWAEERISSPLTDRRKRKRPSLKTRTSIIQISSPGSSRRSSNGAHSKHRLKPHDGASVTFYTVVKMLIFDSRAPVELLKPGTRRPHRGTSLQYAHEA